MSNFQAANNEVIKGYKQSLRKLNKQIKEVKDSILFFSTHSFDDVPASYVSELQGKLIKLDMQANEYKALISGLNSLAK